MNDCWQEKDVQLPFLLGELHLGALHLRGMVVNHGLHPRYGLKVPELPPAVEVAVIRSHPLSCAFPDYVGSAAAFRYVPDRYHRCYVNLQQTLADYLKKFTSKSRYTLLKKVRRLTTASGGAIVMREFTRPQQMDEFLSLAREISTKTYQERLLHAGIPDDPAFVAEMGSLAARDAVRAYTLFLHDHPVAYMYCAAVEASDLMYRFVGHDPEYGRFSPGVVLQYLALERLFQEQRFAFLDFAEGTGMHKVFFSTGSMACADVLLLSRYAPLSRSGGAARGAASHLANRVGSLRSVRDQARAEETLAGGNRRDCALGWQESDGSGSTASRQRPRRRAHGKQPAKQDR